MYAGQFSTAKLGQSGETIHGISGPKIFSISNIICVMTGLYFVAGRGGCSGKNVLYYEGTFLNSNSQLTKCVSGTF